MPKIEESALANFFGESPFIKVIDTLMDHPNYDYSKKELAEVSDISKPTLYKIWDKLEDKDIVEPTRKIANTQLYKLNTESELVKELYQFEQKIMEEEENSNSAPEQAA